MVSNDSKIVKIEYQTQVTSSKRFDELFLDKTKVPFNKKKERPQRRDF